MVDRFLEHSRIYWFLNGGEEETFLASADWMTRNFDKRIELLFPVERAEHKAKVLTPHGDVQGQREGAAAAVRRHVPSPRRPRRRAALPRPAGAAGRGARAAQLAREGAGVSFHPDQRARPRPDRRVGADPRAWGLTPFWTEIAYVHSDSARLSASARRSGS